MKQRFTFIIGIAALLFGAAQAETVKGPGFSAVFPCKAKQTSQNVAAGAQTIPIVNYGCESGGSVYFLVSSTYPRGFIAKKTIPAAFKDAVAGAAANARGTITSDRPITLGTIAGHDVQIDVPASKAAARLHVFFLGDRQFQVMVVAAKGHETGKPATAFLGSFKLKK